MVFICYKYCIVSKFPAAHFIVKLCERLLDVHIANFWRGRRIPESLWGSKCIPQLLLFGGKQRSVVVLSSSPATASAICTFYAQSCLSAEYFLLIFSLLFYRYSNSIRFGIWYHTRYLLQYNFCWLKTFKVYSISIQIEITANDLKTFCLNAISLISRKYIYLYMHTTSHFFMRIYRLRGVF